MNNLGQYYTHDIFSQLLLSKIFIKNPQRVLELGVGEGSLFRAAKQKWKDSDIIAGDIDYENVKSLKVEFPSTNLYVINGLSSNLSNELKIELGSVDVAICNPPYMTIKKSQEYDVILEKSNLGNLIDYCQITSDLIFLAQNLLMLKDGGELGIIIPDGLLTSHYFAIFRTKIINNYKVKAIIELPCKIFKKTEAKTHILIIKKSNAKYNKVPLYIADENGNIQNRINVNKQNLIFRMDYKYHFWKLFNCNKGRTLKDLGVEIYRGSISKKELELSGKKYIHTTNLKLDFSNKKFETTVKTDKYRYAESGDILMSRVGKRCIGKMMYVTSGNILISDCIYRIRVSKEFKQIVINSLTSENGKKWIKAHAHGVCAKVISKEDLLNFKVFE